MAASVIKVSSLVSAAVTYSSEFIGQGCGTNNAKLRLAEKVWSSNHFVLLGDYKFALRSSRGDTVVSAEDTVIMVLAQNEQALAQGLLE
jgi:hypothetical protein